MSENRKRISFWEPESPVIQNWIKNQTSLGKSLELIIADAMMVYGEGDVIHSYLNLRVRHMQENSSPHFFPPHELLPSNGSGAGSNQQRTQDPVSGNHQIHRDTTNGSGSNPGSNSDHGSMMDQIRRDATSGSGGNPGSNNDHGSMMDQIRRDATSGSGVNQGSNNDHGQHLDRVSTREVIMIMEV
ncbi:hypothetical protein ASD24_24885 [Paenibacillus sp. Root52]|uniref:hypothetical protein n=1 Tax=Paenibacillus sp. Root52 TaxID=1736552 RepID=UPI0006FA91DB|nr:hypothetical protein [Paenibacillus sp. Root52]KQY91035.1 hypothetical protein ASD24_24885 [Paenibacillus sp. Root52]